MARPPATAASTTEVAMKFCSDTWPLLSKASDLGRVVPSLGTAPQVWRVTHAHAVRKLCSFHEHDLRSKRVCVCALEFYMYGLC
eukprot:5889008-Prymnesium_polylepis.1